MRQLLASLRALLSAEPSTPVLVRHHHRVEEGMNHHDGKWAIVRIEHRLAGNGEVISERRRLVAWRLSPALAQQECDRLNGIEYGVAA